VDGVEVSIAAGDNGFRIAEKINRSGAAVTASIDPASGGLNLETTDSHQLWLKDTTGTTLADLGLIRDATQGPPHNIAPAANVTGGSLFDGIMALRDAMLKGDQEAIGGRILGALDQGLENLTRRIAEAGSAFERATANIHRNEESAFNVEQQIAREGDVDMAEALMDLANMDVTYRASRSSASKLYDTTLLNYMR
jgi:flagellar hook-associated protein 3 FlgL